MRAAAWFGNGVMSQINLPKGRALAGAYAKTLSAQANLLPSLLATQADTQPISTATRLADIQQLLLGTPEGDYETQEYTPAVYLKNGRYSYGPIPKGVQGLINYPELPDARGGGGG